ncbi:TPM domain-containing protein [Schleiferilactobacillus harbinensis]|uniref:TPM domain-containing protein n=1 Tax=Schleiferilactobacillus harbinensis TaxID=304207 RepID=UPI0039ECACCA
MHDHHFVRRWLGRLLFLTAALLLVGLAAQTAAPARAADEIYVEDNAGVLSTKTKDYINDISNNQLSKLKGKPQYAVITEKHIPSGSDIEDQGAELFQKWGIGHKGWDNGLLFLIAVDDHKYHLEVGYGLEPVITDSIKEDIITNDVTRDLKNQDYDAAITKISERLTRKLQSATLDTPLQITERRQQDAAKKHFWSTVWLILGALAVLLILLGILWYMVKAWRRRRHFLALTKDRYNNVLAPYFHGVDTWHAVKSAGLDPRADDDEMLEYADQNVVLNYLNIARPGRTPATGQPLDYDDIISDMDLAPLIPHFTMANLLTAMQEHLAQREQQRASNQHMIAQAVSQYMGAHPELQVSIAAVVTAVSDAVDLDKPSDVVARRLTAVIKDQAVRLNVRQRFQQLAEDHPEKVPDRAVFLDHLNDLSGSNLDRLNRANDMEFYAILALLMAGNDHHHDDSGPFGGFWGGGSSGGGGGSSDGGSFGGGFGGGSSGGGGFSGGW